jgi:putative ABC transport system permease protein
MPEIAKPTPKKRYASTPLSILVYIAWRNLVSKKLRAFLTVFGVVIGISAIYFLLSFGLGLQHLVTSQVIGSQSIKSIDVTSSNSKIVKLNTENLQKIKKLPHVVQIGASYSYAASVKYKGGDVDAVSYGVDQSYQSLSNLHVVSGRLLTNTDTKTMVVNKAALRTIGLPDVKESIGKQLAVKIPLELSSDGADIDDTYTIVGIVDAGSGVEIYLPNYIFQVAGITLYSQFKLEADNSVNVAGLRAQIESLGFLTSSPIDTIDQINQIFKFFNVLLVGFGAIGMIVAVLGMFNTLTISLLERTKEIGLMLALGGRNRDMRKLFVFEAALLSLAGALIGILFAVVGGVGVNLLMNHLARSRGVQESFDLFATPIWLTGGAIVFMLSVGLAVVFFPARRAEKINPIDALRRE